MLLGFGPTMAFLKSWAGRLFSGLDRMVAELEDHDALVASALRELERAEREAWAEIERVREDGSGLERRIAQERVNADAWRGMATRERSDHEALELLRQARRAARRADYLRGRVAAHRAAEARLVEHASMLRDRIEQTKHQQQLMRSRSAEAEAIAPSSFTATPIEELFERWDMVLTRTQNGAEPPGERSPMDEERALREELAALRNEEEEAL